GLPPGPSTSFPGTTTTGTAPVDSGGGGLIERLGGGLSGALGGISGGLGTAADGARTVVGGAVDGGSALVNGLVIGDYGDRYDNPILEGLRIIGQTGSGIIIVGDVRDGIKAIQDGDE